MITRTNRIVGVVFALAAAFASLGTPGAAATNVQRSAYAVTTATLNLRTGPGTGYYVKRVMPYGARVYGNAGPYGGHWYKVTYSGTTGYAYGAYLRLASTVTSSGTGSYSSKGEAIATTAKQYVGYRYTYTGNSPSEGFNCVGLTQWVYGRNGISLQQNLQSQASSGWAVSKSSLRPGDLVFFQNTWWAGLSHAGIYIGNGYMVDASSPSTGVVVSSINSTYYASRWYGARRLTN